MHPQQIIATALFTFLVILIFTVKWVDHKCDDKPKKKIMDNKKKISNLTENVTSAILIGKVNKEVPKRSKELVTISYNWTEHSRPWWMLFLKRRVKKCEERQYICNISCRVVSYRYETEWYSYPDCKVIVKEGIKETISGETLTSIYKSYMMRIKIENSLLQDSNEEELKIFERDLKKSHDENE